MLWDFASVVSLISANLEQRNDNCFLKILVATVEDKVISRFHAHKQVACGQSVFPYRHIRGKYSSLTFAGSLA